jgi:hypothetical protein
MSHPHAEAVASKARASGTRFDLYGEPLRAHGACEDGGRG